MTAITRRRLAIGVVIAAAALVGGRALSAIYADYSWYAAHGATPLWNERAGDSLLVYGIGFTLGVVIAFVNLSALGRSIGVLTLPRRLANVEFGEAVPRRYIDRFAFVLALAIAAAVTPVLPRWTTLALAKLDVSFRESDPYFQHDLAFYTTWLPFEKATYAWAMLLIVIVSVLVVLLYSLTPGLRWERAGLRMSARSASPECAGGAPAPDHDVELSVTIVRFAGSRQRRGGSLLVRRSSMAAPGSPIAVDCDSCGRDHRAFERVDGTAENELYRCHCHRRAIDHGAGSHSASRASFHVQRGADAARAAVCRDSRRLQPACIRIELGTVRYAAKIGRCRRAR